MAIKKKEDIIDSLESLGSKAYVGGEEVSSEDFVNSASDSELEVLGKVSDRVEEAKIQKGIKDGLIYRDEEGKIHNLTEELPKEHKTSKNLRYTVSGTPEVAVIEDETFITKDTNGLTMKQEMFCQYYVCHEPTRFNGRRSYALGYGYDLEKADTEEIRDELTGKLIKRSERARMENVCDVGANYTLSITKVQNRITKLLNDMMRDEIVDGEMAKMILGPDGASKREMIKEYNKVQQRVTAKTKDESESDKAKTELYKTLEGKVKEMSKEEVAGTIQDLLSIK